MATHTTQGGGGYARKFHIGRENGQSDKNGRPYFFEWLQNLPEDKTSRKFETRTNAESVQRHYELFAALDGYLFNVDEYSLSFNGTQRNERWLVLSMIDANEEYRIEVGKMDSRWSMDIMKRLLDPNFNPNFKLRISPFSITTDGKTQMGLAAISGVDGKLVAKFDSPHLAGMPQAEQATFKGETLWNFEPVANWLFEQVKAKVCPRLTSDPITRPICAPIVPMPAPAPTPPAATFPANEMDTNDDLPF